MAQQEAYRKKREREQKRADKRRTSNVLGNFYFILAENPFFDLKPETVTKLIMLCSYLNYDNSFMLTQRTPMRKSDVQSVLKVSRSTAYNFYKEVAPKYINDVNGQLFLSDNTIFIKGKINNPNYKHYQQFYVDSVRRLYNSTPNKHHAQLGYIFKLLPYINIEFNILCHNPFEEQINQIKVVLK